MPDTFLGYSGSPESQSKPCLHAGPEAANDIAKRMGGKIRFDHPGSPGATAYIKFGTLRRTPSFATAESRLEGSGFSNYINANPEHYGGADFKGHGIDGNWYHVTVGYPPGIGNNATNSSAINDKDPWRIGHTLDGTPFDTHGRVPWITIHCENGDPAYIFHG